MTANHKQYKKRLWKKRILDAYTSNLTVKDWCNQNNISATYFYDWKIALERSGDIPRHFRKILKQYINDEVQCVKEEKPKKEHEEITPVFCELPIPEDIDLLEENSAYISKETTFLVGKFSLSVQEDVSEDMINAALEALNTVMEVFDND